MRGLYAQHPSRKEPRRRRKKNHKTQAKRTRRERKAEKKDRQAFSTTLDFPPYLARTRTNGDDAFFYIGYALMKGIFLVKQIDRHVSPRQPSILAPCRSPTILKNCHHVFSNITDRGKMERKAGKVHCEIERIFTIKDQ